MATVSCTELGTGQGQKHADAGRQAFQPPSATDIRKHPDRDFRHGKACCLGADTMTGPHHQPHTSAHDNPATPTQDRLGIPVYQVIEPVLHCKKFARILVAPGIPWHRLLHGGVQAVQVSTSTESLVTFAGKYDQGYGVVDFPLPELD